MKNVSHHIVGGLFGSIGQFFSFNRIISQHMDSIKIIHFLRIKSLKGRIIHYLGFNGQLKIHDAIERLKPKHEIAYFDIPKKLDNDTFKPVFFHGINEILIDNATYKSRFNIASLNLKKYWYFISLIKFKNYVFVSLVVLDRNE